MASGQVSPRGVSHCNACGGGLFRPDPAHRAERRNGAGDREWWSRGSGRCLRQQDLIGFTGALESIMVPMMLDAWLLVILEGSPMPKIHEEELKTEDEIAREKLGPRGLPGERDPVKLTP